MKALDIRLSRGPVHCRVHDQGDGDWVVLVHGLITPQFAWQFLFEALVAKGYRVVSFDLYGRGQSAIPKINYTFTHYLQQLDEVVQYFCGARRHHLIGWSMGGAICSLYSMKWGYRLKKLVLIAPGIKITSGYFIRRILQYDAASALFARIGARVLRKRMREQFHAPDQFDEYYANAMAQTRRPGFWPALTSIMSNYPENLMEILKYYPEKSPRPLVIWGEEDEITAYRDSGEVAALLGGELRSFSKAAHAVHYEYPDKVNDVIIGFLA